VAQSYSKNLGLYGERVGALNVVLSDAEVRGVGGRGLRGQCGGGTGMWSLCVCVAGKGVVRGRVGARSMW
jgi:hypothetical protein